MTFTLRIFLMGLAVLVQREEGPGLFLVLPGARDHAPILVCDSSVDDKSCQLNATNQGPDISDLINQVDPDLSDRIKGYVLAGEELRIIGSRPGNVFAVDNAWDPRWLDDWIGAIPKDGLRRRDISWVPPMKRILGEASIIHEDVLLRPRSRGVVALTDLTGIEGLLKTFHLAEQRGQVPSLTFRRSSDRIKLKSVKQALADILVIEIPIVGDEAILALSVFGSSASPKTMTLKPKAGERVVEVLLGNLTALDDEREDCNQEVVHHFDHYYNLAASKVHDDQRLIPYVGFRKVDASQVNPNGRLPGVLGIVSDEEYTCQGENGLSRPICTFGSMVLP